MSLAKLNKDLARAFERRGISVESALDTPGDTPCHADASIGDAGQDSAASESTIGFGLLSLGLIFGQAAVVDNSSPKRQPPSPAAISLSNASTDAVATPYPTPRLLPCRTATPDQPASQGFLFSGACLRPHQEGSLGSRSIEERVRSGRELLQQHKELHWRGKIPQHCVWQDDKNHMGLHEPAASALMRQAAAAMAETAEGEQQSY